LLSVISLLKKHALNVFSQKYGYYGRKQKLTEEKFTQYHKIFALLGKKCYFCLSNYYLKPNKVNYYTNNEKLS